MKKVLIILFVIAAVIFMLDDEPKKVTYSESEMREAIEEAEYYAYKRGYEEGYDLAKYEDKGELEKYEYYLDSAYDAGYEEGYGDCLVDHGLSTEDYHGSAWIKKDK
jgi:hypothetical protein